MENSDILSIIFKYLSLKDLITCSYVSKKWNKVFKIIKPRHLFFSYGTDSFNQNKLCLHKSLIQIKNCLTPLDVFDNSFLNSIDNDLMKNIETFIFYGNNNFVPTESFNLYMFPKLKHVEIIDLSFCETIKKNFLNYLNEKKYDPVKQWKYFSPSIETLVMSSISLSMILLSLANIKNLIIYDIDCKFKLDINEVEMKNWKTLTIKKQYLAYEDDAEEYLLEFLHKKCPFLESIEININFLIELEKLLSNFNFKNICVNIYLLSNIMSDKEEYEFLISKYKANIKFNCNLCVNFLSLKFYHQYKDKEFFERFTTSENHPFLINELEKNLEINHFPGLKVLKNCYKFDCLEEVRIENSVIGNFHLYQNLIFYLKKLIKSLPKSVEILFLSLNDFISQDNFDLISEHLPKLKRLKIQSSKSKILCCNFISNLKFLNNLTLRDLIVNCEDLVNAIDKLKFINHVSLSLGNDQNLIIKPMLKNVLEKKKFSNYCLRFN